MKFNYFATIAILALSAFVSAQPRAVDKSSNPADVKPAPASFNAKYEGGVFGFEKKEEGVLRFDDANERLVFFGEDKKEKFGIPYDAFLIVSTSEKSVTSTTGKKFVARSVAIWVSGLSM